MLHSLSGVLSGTPTTVGTYNFQVQAANTSGGDPDITPTITIGVGNGSTAPTITTTATSTSVQVGQALSFNVTASGQPLPSLAVAGTLPAGVTFVDNGNGSGTFAGTPPDGSEGSYPVTLTASNGVTPSATQTFTIGVTGIAPAFVNQSAPTTASSGVAYSYTYTASGDPAPTFTVASGSLPPGLTLSTAGVLAGTPTTAGPYTFTVKATNASGTPAVSTSQTVTVSAPTSSADIEEILTGPASVAANATATYGVAAKNLGPNTATAVQEVLVVPSDMTVTAVPTGVTYANGQLTLTAASVASGADIKFSVVLKPLSAGTATLSATASSALSDPVPANNTGTLTTVIKPATGAPNYLVVAPANTTTAAGVPQAFTATEFTGAGVSLGDVTSATTFTIGPDGTCAAASCSASTLGAHTITATDGAATGTTTLTIQAATAEDNFLRGNTTAGWGTTTNTDGLANLPWQTELDGSSPDGFLSGQHGVIVYTGTDGHKLEGYLNTPAVLGGDTATEFSFSNTDSELAGVIVQHSNSTNWYQADISTVTGYGFTANTLELTIRRAGVMIHAATVPFAVKANTNYWIREVVQVSGGVAHIMARAWAAGTPEPTTWSVTYNDTTPLAAGNGGVMGDWLKSPQAGEQILYSNWSYTGI